MSLYLTEDEQIDRIKAWWKKYGNRFLIVLLIIVAFYLGWRWWHQRTVHHVGEASLAYEQLLVEVASGDLIDSDIYANNIINAYPNTIYAQMAALLMAQQFVYNNDLAAASQHLQWVIDRAKNAHIEHISRIRDARILLADGQPKIALERLNTVKDDLFLPLIAQVRGDIYADQKNYKQARQAYRDALAATDQPGMMHYLLQMKLNNLPVL